MMNKQRKSSIDNIKLKAKNENNNIIAENENKEAEQKGNNILEQLSSEDINELSEINSVECKFKR